MKIVLLTFSITGNTAHVADSISKTLSKYGHSVQLFDAVSLVKLLGLAQKVPELKHQPAPTGHEVEILSLLSAIKEADAFGVGSYVFNFFPAPGVLELLDDKWMPPELFESVKMFFTFTTHGSLPHPVGDILATCISKKNPAMLYAGNINVRVPENFVPLQPHKPYYDIWDPVEIKLMEEKIDRLRVFLSFPSSSVQFTHVDNPDVKRYISPSTMMGAPLLDKEKCKKCGLCVMKCPYNLIQISPDIEDGFPVFQRDGCYGCGRCFNSCRQEAINFTLFDSKNRSRYCGPVFPGEKRALDGKESGIEYTPIPDVDNLLKRIQFEVKP